MKNDLNNIDTLGALLAKIADLTEDAELIKAELREAATAPNGSNVFEGDLFKATVVESNRSTVNWKKLCKDLKIDETVLAQYTGTTAVFSVKVTSR